MKSWVIVSIIVCFYMISTYFLILFYDNEVSIKYEIFEPTESYYFETLNIQQEKTDYVQEVREHQESLFHRRTNYALLFSFTFLISTGLLIFRRRIPGAICPESQ